MTALIVAASVALSENQISGGQTRVANIRELYQQAIEAYNAHDLDRFMEYYTDDCDLTVPGFPPFRGKAATRECWRLFMESFPDEH